MKPMDLANAFPKKTFFIQMFKKDISLEDSILDLVDNSIDGLVRTEHLNLSHISKWIFKKNGHLPAKHRFLPAIRDCSEKTCNLLRTKSNHVFFDRPNRSQIYVIRF